MILTLKNNLGIAKEGTKTGKLEVTTTPKEIADESGNVTNVGGFYISRYEAGDGSTGTDRTDSSGTTGKLVSKKDAYVYNWIFQTDAKEKAKEFTNKGLTDLCVKKILK